MSHVPAGKRVACRCPGFLTMSIFRNGPLHADGRASPAPSRSPARPPRRRARSIRSSSPRTREPQALSSQQRRRRRHRRRDDPQHAPPIRSRTCCAAPPACSSRRNGGPGQTSGYFVRGTGTSSTVVLVDGVRVGSATARPGRVRGAQPGADRSHRGPARPGVQPLRRRRRGRRDPDLHPAR